MPNTNLLDARKNKRNEFYSQEFSLITFESIDLGLSAKGIFNFKTYK
jgi:hypothetical protein